MIYPSKKIFFNFFFNTTLFLFLIISIQNSNKTNKVDFIVNETIELPISFIIGASFIAGSIMGSLIPLTTNRKN